MPQQPLTDAIDGEIGRRIRLLREARRLPMAEIAQRLGKSVGFVSQVERGLSSLAVRELVRIAEILEVDFLSLVCPAGPGDETSPVRRGVDTAPVPFHPSGVTKRPLAPANPGALQLYAMSLEPGAHTGSDLYHHEGEEAGVVTQGAIRLTVGTETYMLAEGDSFRFASSIPHGFANAAEGRSAVLWVNVKR
ncbi:cupin domain-containing protein [Roseomonas xinghualingensis]|uniref:cupin domain-containing protein n=1 Tax=Roseomonas xinghualingensis TaxID=2986475 RepID=UPI0038D4F04E